MIGNDHWTIEIQKLGMKSAGDELARRALICRPPYAICVQGKWGSGKTSLMRYAMARLGGEPLATALSREEEKPIEELPEDLRGGWRTLVDDSDGFVRSTLSDQLDPTGQGGLEPRVVPIWFNPWQHQRAELPVVGLLNEIRGQFSLLLKFVESAKKFSSEVASALPLLGNLAASIEALTGGASGFGLLAGAAARHAEANADREKRVAHDAQRLNLLFETTVRRLLGITDAQLPAGKKGLVVPRRIVVFIDDLDRCSEEQIVHLLEAIKLYLQTSYCVFVVGMDSLAARRAVSKVLGQGGEISREYLEKLFQTTLHVPLPSRGVAFVEELLDYSALDQTRTGLEAKDLAELILALVEPNPRKLKTFVSGLAAGWCLDGQSGRDFKAYLLLTYLRTVHPDVFRLLAYDPDQAARLHKVLAGGTLDPDASPVDLFMHGVFRHAFAEMSTNETQVRTLMVSELIERLDHLKGDQAFLRLWKEWGEELNGEQVANAVRPLLRREEE